MEKKKDFDEEKFFKQKNRMEDLFYLVLAIMVCLVKLFFEKFLGGKNKKR